MSEVYVTVAVEGDTDASILRRLFSFVGLNIASIYGLRGKDQLDKQLPGYNNAARFAPWLVLRDLDEDASCAPDLVRTLLLRPAINMRFRIAVAATEAWLMADRDRFARFLGVPSSKIPLNPETVLDPKRFVVNLARKSTKRGIREEMIPTRGTSASVGPGYTSRLIEFAINLWRPDQAAQRSDSLERCIRCLRNWL